MKRFFVNKADFWFGYTEHTRALLHNQKVPDHKIMIVNNSTSTEQIVSARKNLKEVSNVETMDKKVLILYFVQDLIKVKQYHS